MIAGSVVGERIIEAYIAKSCGKITSVVNFRWAEGTWELYEYGDNFLREALGDFTRFFVCVCVCFFFFFCFFFSSWDVLAKPGSTKQSAKHSTGPTRNMQKKKKRKKEKKKNTQTNKKKKEKQNKTTNKQKQNKKQNKTKKEKKKRMGWYFFFFFTFSICCYFCPLSSMFTIRPTCCKKMLFKKGIAINV